MAHRGRLNVLAHIIDRPYEEVLREFEGERTIEAVAATAEGASGDVKYHLGAVGRRKRRPARPRPARRANPSHLEAVDPVVEGITRRAADGPLGAHRRPRPGRRPTRSSSMVTRRSPAQGVVAETLNLQSLVGYTTGRHAPPDRQQPGRIHDRARRRAIDPVLASDLAKGFDTPIIHVNADDPEAAISAIRLASPFAADSDPMSSSTLSATGATGTTRATSRRSPNR